MFNFVLLFRNYGILLVTILLFVILAVTADGFATERNLRNILDQQSMVIIAASFMTIAIISGNFDVSVSAIFVTAPLTPGQADAGRDLAAGGPQTRRY